MAIPLYCQVHDSCPSYVESTLASLACQKRQGTRVIGCFESSKLPLRLEMLDFMVRANLQMRDRKLAMRISKLCKTFGVEIDSRNKHVLVGSGATQAANGGKAGDVEESYHPSTGGENAMCEAAQEAGSGHSPFLQQQQELSGAQAKDEADTSGCWTPHNSNSYWEQDNSKSNWQPGGAQKSRGVRWAEAPGDRSWEWENRSWESARKPWANEHKNQYRTQSKPGAYSQLCSSAINKNCRKTWTPAEKVRSSQAPSLTACVDVMDAQPSKGSSIRPPPGLEPECDKAMGPDCQGQHNACKLAAVERAL